MATAARAAVIGMAQQIAGMNIEEATRTGYSIGLSDVQALAREFLALREEKIKVAGMFDGPGVNAEITPIDIPWEESDAEVRLAALRTAAETYTHDSSVHHGAPDDVVAIAFVYRAFLQGGHDVELLERVTREDGGTALHKLVLGDK